MKPFDIVKGFEDALCEYTGARYAVTTTSCTTALLLSLLWARHSWRVPTDRIVIPKKTYIGVPMSILNAGYKVGFDDIEWRGEYSLYPLPIWDSARRLTSGMYRPGCFQCLSFHWSKILSVGQGGAILLDDEDAYEWLKRARFDGRTEGVPAKKDVPEAPGFHAYMMPRDAAEGLTRLGLLPEHNDDLPNSDYPDLSLIPLFQCD